MTNSSKFALSVLLAGGIAILTLHGMRALGPSVPTNMPSDSHFIQSGYDLRHNEPLGNWISCRADAAQAADFCRVTDNRGIVIYQGEFTSLSGSRAVPQADLRFTPADPRGIWTRGPAENAPVPVIFLVGGQILVPAADSDALANRWAKDPDELARLEAFN